MCPFGNESFFADGRTDISKLIVAFRYFAYAPKSHSLNVVSGNNISEILSNHSNALCGQDVEFFNVNPGGT